jgi:hypothetical protein
MVAAGVGGSAFVTHALGGITYRTFPASAKSVKTASIRALNKMGFRVLGTEQNKNGSETLKAQGSDREIEITFERLTPSTTRMKVLARDGAVFFDGATAQEIIQQTEKRLARA